MATDPTQKYVLYFDDTGSRHPDKDCFGTRKDEMNCFGLGGILIKAEDTNLIWEKHRTFCDEWAITYPLHSSSIRGGRGNFGWLKAPDKAVDFISALEEFLLSLPFISTACIIDRPGYVARYKDTHKDKLWMMCKTAFAILVERAARFADSQSRKLEIFFEETSKRDDREIIRYMQDLKKEGSPFSPVNSEEYRPLSAEDYRRIVLGSPQRRTKKVPMIQIADLVLYPIAKGGYDPKYRPYQKLLVGRKIIDALLSAEDVSAKGVKYSCFPTKKLKAQDNLGL
jgi:Protein of unknown function (DUF3800)